MNYLGNISHKKSSKPEMIKSLTINIFIIFYKLFVIIIPTMFYIFEFSNDIANLLLPMYQLSGFGSSLFSYTYVCCHKEVVNEFFSEIEIVVRKRMGFENTNDAYQRAIEQAEKSVKYPPILITISVAVNACVTFGLCVIFDLVKGEINVGKWNLLFRMKYADISGVRIVERRIIFFLSSRMPWSEDTIPKYVLSLLIQIVNTLIPITTIFSQIGFITDLNFYLSSFVADIRYQMLENDISNEQEMKKKLLDVVGIHLSIIR